MDSASRAVLQSPCSRSKKVDQVLDKLSQSSISSSTNYNQANRKVNVNCEENLKRQSENLSDCDSLSGLQNKKIYASSVSIEINRKNKPSRVRNEINVNKDLKRIINIERDYENDEDDEDFDIDCRNENININNLNSSDYDSLHNTNSGVSSADNFWRKTFDSNRSKIESKLVFKSFVFFYLYIDSK